jgi:hypothetical protein
MLLMTVSMAINQIYCLQVCHVAVVVTMVDIVVLDACLP